MIHKKKNALNIVMKINYSTYILIVEVIKIKYAPNLKIVHNLQAYNQF